MNHIKQIDNMKPILADYDFPIDTISMAGTYDDDCETKLVKCNDRMMIVRTDTMEYLGNHSVAYRRIVTLHFELQFVTHIMVYGPL